MIPTISLPFPVKPAFLICNVTFVIFIYAHDFLFYFLGLIVYISIKLMFIANSSMTFCLKCLNTKEVAIQNTTR